MQRDRHKRLYNVHSWSGIVLGLLIYVVAFSGTAAMFADEIKAWEDPSLRLAVPETAISIDAEFRQFQTEATQLGDAQFLIFNFPDDHYPYYEALTHIHIEGEVDRDLKRKWNPTTGEVLAERGQGLSEWILDFHRNFMLPRTLGRALVGIVGMVLMLSILTGILIHGKIIKEFFTLRLKRSQRLKWQDSHKVLGIISLPFSTMMAFTGAFLGVIAILAPIIAFLAFKGDQDALINAVLGEPLQPSGEIAEMISMDQIYALQHPDTGTAPYRVIMTNYGDTNAQFDVLFKADLELATTEIMPVNGATGEPLEATLLESANPANRVVNAMSPLHYGTFGGVWLKWLYVLLGLGLCALTATGLMLWVERRQHGSEGKRSELFYETMTRVNIGVCLGFPVATISLFYLDKLYLGAEAARLFWTGWTYFGVVALTVIYAFTQTAHYRTTQRLLILCGVMLMGLPLLNMLTTGSRMWVSTGVGQSFSNGVDLSCFVLGCLTIVVSYQIPKRRNAGKSAVKSDILMVAAE